MVLPSMMLVPAMPAVAAEAWVLLCLLPYPTRYRLYNELRVRRPIDIHIDVSASATVL